MSETEGPTDEKDKWISVAERLPELRDTYEGGPKESEPVLAFENWVEIARYGETFRTRKPRWATLHRRITPTHWMPLPDPPKEKP